MSSSNLQRPTTNATGNHNLLPWLRILPWRRPRLRKGICDKSLCHHVTYLTSSQRWPDDQKALVSKQTQVNRWSTYQDLSTYKYTSRCNTIGLVDTFPSPLTVFISNRLSQNPARAWPLIPVFQHARRFYPHYAMYARIIIHFVIYKWSRTTYSGTIR